MYNTLLKENEVDTICLVDEKTAELHKLKHKIEETYSAREKRLISKMYSDVFTMFSTELLDKDDLKALVYLAKNRGICDLWKLFLTDKIDYIYVAVLRYDICRFQDCKIPIGNSYVFKCIFNFTQKDTRDSKVSNVFFNDSQVTKFWLDSLFNESLNMDGVYCFTDMKHYKVRNMSGRK